MVKFNEGQLLLDATVAHDLLVDGKLDEARIVLHIALIRARDEIHEYDRRQSCGEIMLVPAPEDFDHPAEDKVFQVGDYVISSDGYSGEIVEVRDHYFNRAEQRVNRTSYRVDVGALPGAPRVWFFGYELGLVKARVDDSF